nr:hypothetical protein Iba_chr13cCG9810 [Ipomoea batatas]
MVPIGNSSANTVIRSLLFTQRDSPITCSIFRSLFSSSEISRPPCRRTAVLLRRDPTPS